MPINNDQANEINSVLNEDFSTIRATVPALEEILYKPIKVLDHGFVRVVDYMGDDSAIVQAARVSYGKGTKKVNEDKGLIRYLMRHRHTTPFEMCDIKFHIKLPIFVARQWIRHRTASVNEYSARYSILGNEFYIPQRDHLGAQATTNRQGRAEVLNDQEAAEVLALLEQDSQNCYKNYSYMLNSDEQGNVFDENRQGLSRELARMNLTLNFYTEWYWKTNLHNLMHFLSLRADSHAQYEIRVYAEAMLEVLRRWVPITYEAYSDYRVGSVNLSNTAKKIIQRMIRGEQVQQAESGLSKREWNELMESLELEAQLV